MFGMQLNKRKRFFSLVLYAYLGVFITACGADDEQEDGLETSDLSFSSPTPSATPVVIPAPVVTPTPNPSPTPSSLPQLCADKWESLSVSGLSDEDEINISWNSGWQGQFVGNIGNTEIESRHFSHCLSPAPSSQAFEIIDANGYSCSIDDSVLWVYTVSCVNEATSAAENNVFRLEGEVMDIAEAYLGADGSLVDPNTLGISIVDDLLASNELSLKVTQDVMIEIQAPVDATGLILRHYNSVDGVILLSLNENLIERIDVEKSTHYIDTQVSFMIKEGDTIYIRDESYGQSFILDYLDFIQL